MKVHKFIIFFLLSTYSIFAEISIDINFPDSFYVDLEDDYEPYLLSQISYFQASELEPLVNNMLIKPQVTYSLSQSLGLSTALPQIGAYSPEGKAYLFIGSDGAVVSPYYNREVLTAYLETLSIESDPSLGAGVQLWEGGVGIPLTRWRKRMTAGIGGGWLDFRQEDILIKNYTFQTSLRYGVFREIPLHRAIGWNPLVLTAGTSYRHQEVLVKPDMGTITQSFSIDPDGDGPLPPQSIDLEAESRFYLKVTSDALTFPLQINTEFRFFRTFNLALGGSFIPAWTSSGIGLEGEGEVYLLGYQADILGISEEDYGTITASGSVDGEGGTLFSGFGWFRLQVDMGKLFFSLPVLFQPPDRVGAGAYLGVVL